MIKKLTIGCLLLLSFLYATAQQNSITGKVVTGTNKAALPNASVFIRGTSKGTISAADGSFALHNISPGSYDLVISSVGYTTVLYSFTADKLPLTLTIEMTLKVTELDAVTVEPFDEETWEKWGQFFTESFIGTSDAAKQTRILNHKVIRFRFYKKRNALEAIADEPLIIENRALGYRIKYYLEEFSWSGKDQSIVFLGYELFEDMAENRKRIPKRWVDNRRKAYMGSIVHFMRSLYNNRLVEENFNVRRLVKERNVEKDRVRAVYALEARKSVNSGGVTVMRIGGTLPADSNAYYEKIMRQPDYIDIFGTATLTADSIVTVRNDSARILFFPNYLYITYTAAKEEEAYLKAHLLSRKPWYPSSPIFLQSGSPVIIDRNGLYNPPQEIFSLGYWAWSEKIAHMLPVDYEIK